ncbi:MAG TPA: hypothetical protein VF173_13875 [Thermoanaerobaculia bacterium]|nr:hypothetical protein [Thermoanaerobaculia bacterium]
MTALWALSPAPAAPPSELRPDLPRDVSAAHPTQTTYDDFAWQLFVALNWPAKDGKADPSKAIGQAPEAPRVWDFFTDTTEIFHSSSLCPDQKASPELKVLRMSRDNTGKVDGLDVQAGSNWPLVDQNQNFAMVEIAVNDLHKGYITANGLTTPGGIQKYIEKSTILFPDGAMEVKAAWRLFPAGTDPQVLARYHTKKAVICVSQEQSADKKAFTLQGTVGLVGLHIVYKTRNQPHWTWSTFEQVDNYEISYKPLRGLKPTFSNGGDLIDPNRQPAPIPSQGELYKWSAAQPTASAYDPTQVARCPNEPALPAAVNAKWQAALAGVPGVPNSPWQYYRLVATQWFDANDRLQPKNTDGVAISRNSTLETYLLGDQTIAGQVPAIGPVVSAAVVSPPNSTLADTIVATIVAASTPTKTGPYTWSSCVLCHQMAIYQYGPNGTQDVVKTDSSFVFRSNLAAGGAVSPKGQ